MRCVASCGIWSASCAPISGSRQPTGIAMNPFETSLWDVIDTLRAADGRYRREAYAFVVAALGVTVQALPAERLNHPELRHLSGQELLRGVIALARAEFG